MREEGRVRRIRDSFNPVLTAEAELLLLQAGLLDPDFEDDPLPGEAWLRRLEYQGPPQFSPEERIERIFDPVRIANHYKGYVAAYPGRVPMATNVTLDRLAEQMSALTAIVGNMVKAQFSAPTVAAQPVVSPAPAVVPPATIPPTATAPRKSTRKTKSPAQTSAPSAAPAHPVKDKSFTIQLVKFGSTLNSVKYRELVNGQPLAVESTGYAGGFIGDIHLRAEALAAAGLLKRSGKKADGPETISLTVTMK